MQCDIFSMTFHKCRHWYYASIDSYTKYAICLRYIVIVPNYTFDTGLIFLMCTVIRAWLNLLWSDDAMWWHRSESTLAQAIDCCLKAPDHYMDQCWLIPVTSTRGQFHKIYKLHVNILYIVININVSWVRFLSSNNIIVTLGPVH